MPHLEDILVEVGLDEFDPNVDYLEHIGDYQPGGGEAFSLESGEATIVALIPWRKARSFARYALGWSYADKGGALRLRRENPMYHPRFPWLSASTVSFSAFAPDPNPDNDNSATRQPGVYTDSQEIAGYQYVYATIRFTDQPWAQLEDDSIANYTEESRRNTYFDPVPSVEMISAEGLSVLIFANGPLVNEPVPAPFGTLMAKTTYTLNWMQVPTEYISADASGVFRPRWIESCTGCVNSDTFMGFPPGTLLMQAPVYQRFRFPVLTAGGVHGYFGWNIRIPLQFFDPIRGVEDVEYRGHQCLPNRDNLKWYGARRGQPNNDLLVRLFGPLSRVVDLGKLYPEAEFANIFRHIAEFPPPPAP